MADYADLFVSAADGLRLFARDYGPRTGTALAVVCLPGLARTSADFHELALSLSQDGKRSRRVLALDYRGRGRSEYDRDWRNYDLKVELADVLAVLTAASIEEAMFVGTSRGGLLTMALSAARPALLRGAVLNDIGPVIEGRGLARIRGYVGKLPAPADYGEAVDILKKLMSAQFTALSEEEWRSWAEATWKEENGRARCGLRSRPGPHPREHRSGGAAGAVLVPVRGSQARAGAGAARRELGSALGRNLRRHGSGASENRDDPRAEPGPRAAAPGPRPHPADQTLSGARRERDMMAVAPTRRRSPRRFAS